MGLRCRHRGSRGWHVARSCPFCVVSRRLHDRRSPGRHRGRVDVLDSGNQTYEPSRAARLTRLKLFVSGMGDMRLYSRLPARLRVARRCPTYHFLNPSATRMSTRPGIRRQRASSHHLGSSSFFHFCLLMKRDIALLVLERCEPRESRPPGSDRPESLFRGARRKLQSDVGSWRDRVRAQGPSESSDASVGGSMWIDARKQRKPQKKRQKSDEAEQKLASPSSDIG